MRRNETKWQYHEIKKIIDYVGARLPNKDLSIQRKFNTYGEDELAIEEICLIIIDLKVEINIDILRGALAMLLYLNQENKIDIEALVELTVDDSV